MASRVKGITIQIGGDTTGLDKALQSVNRQIRDPQKQLKDVERLLKMDPGNTELLAQKEKLLAGAVEETKEKLNQLREADRQAKAQLEAGDLGQAQYDALQREIIETEQNLQSLEGQAAETRQALSDAADENRKNYEELGEDLKNAGDKMQATGEKIAGAGSKLTKAQSLGIETIDEAELLRRANPEGV